ncbi:MAG: NifU family protein, partial [Armatimonadota bacterium]|nr:NifU family protein [Armatimonadota bacterium]
MSEAVSNELDVRARVERVLEAIRPYIQADGGDIELVDVSDGIVQ